MLILPVTEASGNWGQQSVMDTGSDEHWFRDRKWIHPMMLLGENRKTGRAQTEWEASLNTWVNHWHLWQGQPKCKGKVFGAWRLERTDSENNHISNILIMPQVSSIALATITAGVLQLTKTSKVVYSPCVALPGSQVNSHHRSAPL